MPARSRQGRTHATQPISPLRCMGSGRGVALLLRPRREPGAVAELWRSRFVVGPLFHVAKKIGRSLSRGHLRFIAACGASGAPPRMGSLPRSTNVDEGHSTTAAKTITLDEKSSTCHTHLVGHDAGVEPSAGCDPTTGDLALARSGAGTGS